MKNRISTTFSDNKKKLITFVTGGDPNFETSNKIIDTKMINNIVISH